MNPAAVIDALENRILELEDALGINLVKPWMVPLNPQERQLLGALLHRPLVTRAMGLAAISVTSHDCLKENSERTVYVSLFNVRKFLKKQGIILHRAYKEGWWLDEKDREKLKRELLITGEPKCTERR